MNPNFAANLALQSLIRNKVIVSVIRCRSSRHSNFHPTKAHRTIQLSTDNSNQLIAKHGKAITAKFVKAKCTLPTTP